jgi:CheY-like chemotaxis protein
MDRETVSRIFEPFFTAKEQGAAPDSASRRSTESSGKAADTSGSTASQGWAPLTRFIFRESWKHRILRPAARKQTWHQRHRKPFCSYRRKPSRTNPFAPNDVVMPDMNGRELAEQLLTKRPEMKVFYMSGYTNGILLEHAFRAEDSAFIEKPFSQDALSRKVRHTLKPSSPS